jgi:hypothetical protein
MKIRAEKGRRFKITGQIGEFLVAAELGRRGFISTTFTGNVPEFDIIVTDRKLNTIPIQVKTIRRGGAFQSSLDKWMVVSFREKRKQIIQRKIRLTNPGLIYVMVVLGKKYGDDKFYILTKRQLQEVYFKSYTIWLKSKDGVRPRKPESLHCSIRPKELKSYINKWKILNQ